MARAPLLWLGYECSVVFSWMEMVSCEALPFDPRARMGLVISSIVISMRGHPRPAASKNLRDAEARAHLTLHTPTEMPGEGSPTTGGAGCGDGTTPDPVV